MNVHNKLVFVTCRPSQHSPTFADKARAYLSEVPFSCSTQGRFLALPANISHGLENLLGTNALAYYEHP